MPAADGTTTGERTQLEPGRIASVPLNPQHFGTFLAVVDAGGRMSAAARVLGLSQPGVTHQLNELERRLGVALFDRARGRAARVTRAGRVFERYARSIVGMQAALFADLDQLSQDVSGHLRVGASSGPGESWLPVSLCEFADAHPGVRVEVCSGDARTLVEQVEAAALELAVVGGRWNQPGVQFELVRDEAAVVVAAPGHPLAMRASLDVDELFGARLVVQSPGSALRIALEQELRRRGASLAQFEVLGAFGTHRGVLEAVAAGHGIAVVWESVARMDLERGAVVALDVDVLPGAGQFLVRRPDRRLSRRAAALVEHLRAQHAAVALAAAPAGS